MTFSMIVYHIPSHMVGGTFYDIQLLSHSAAAEFCGVKIPTNRGMLEEGRGHIQGDSPILAPEKPIALGIGDPPPLCWESFPHIPVFLHDKWHARLVGSHFGMPKITW